MQQMSIADAAEHFGISKEAIHNRIRRGSLQSVIEEGVKFVIVNESAPSTTPKRTRQSNHSADERYAKFLEEQNLKLQQRVEKLEDETRTLRDQKEQMLLDERERVENIYREKDEQLKNILNSFRAQFVLPSVQKEEHLEAEIEEVVEEVQKSEISMDVESKDAIISLKKYFKEKNLPQKKCEKIKARFKKRAKKDERIITVGKKYYLNLSKYDYKDLL